MDKEFKMIFDGLRKAVDLAEKTSRLMDKYQDHLDKMVEAGLMTEHEARMDFFNKTIDVTESAKADLWKDEDDDDDAEDEPCDCDDESSEEDCDADENEAVKEAAEKLVDAIRGAGLPHFGCIRIDHAVRRKHRG